MRKLLMILALALTWPAAAVDLPDIGSSVDATLSPQEEQQLGEAFMRKLRQSEKVLDDPEVGAYLQALGYRLVAYSEKPSQPFTFFVLEDPSINAFAVPGGYIGINSGLILNTRNEGELASVLAHEIAHVTQRHIARGAESGGRWSLPALAAVIAAIALGSKNPDIGQAAIAAVTAGTIQMQLNFTRQHEAEADRVGMQILSGAGLDPRSMPAFFERLQSVNRYYEGGLPEFLRFHPVTTDRVAESGSLAEAYPSVNYQDDPLYALMRAKVLVLTSDDPMGLAQQLEQSLASGKFYDQRAVRYALALVRLDLGQAEKVQPHLDWLRQHDGDRVVYRLLAARLAQLERQPRRLLEIYAEALNVYPGDTPISLAYAEALLDQRQSERAEQVLQAVSEPGLPAYYRLLAEAQKANAKPAEALLSLAEHYYMKGQTALALDQLTQAERLPDLSYYLKARIEARLRRLQEDFQQERKRDQE